MTDLQNDSRQQEMHALVLWAVPIVIAVLILALFAFELLHGTPIMPAPG